MARLVGLVLCAAATLSAAPPASGQGGADAPAPVPALSAEEVEAARAQARAVSETLATIRSMLASIAEKRLQAEELRRAIEAAETDVDREAASAELQALNAEIAEIEAQIEGVSTGVAADEADPKSGDVFDLQAELEQLVQPFVLMLKSATENARAIETLKRSILIAERRIATAEKALASLEPLVARAGAGGPIAERLAATETRWRERRDQAADTATAARRQLETRLAAQQDPTETAGEAFQSFFSERGRNLAFGFTAFTAVFFLLRLVRRGALAALGAPRNRSVPARLAAFLFDGLTIVAAFGAMLSVFNLYNDWLLTGLTVLVLLALGWFVLRSAPALFEQVTLLLNLGAVQEGERVMLAGVPWRVKRLDFYTDLENPALRGGAFTVPIRELRGLHSRPMDAAEVWFPSAEGDWVILAGGLFGEVVFQSPELVQLRDEGGARTTFTLEAYLAQAPRNLSRGFRVEAVIGVDYAHQAEALEAIPQALARAARPAIEALAPSGTVGRVEAALVAAGASSLDIEIAADMGGAAAAQHDDLREAMIRAAIACCLKNGWSIPYQTLVLKQG